MEITNNLSAEELALKFSTGDISTEVKQEDKQVLTNIQDLYLGLSSEELAQKAEELVKLKEETLTPEQLAQKKEAEKTAEAEKAKPVPPAKDVLDAQLLSKLEEKFFKTDKLKAFDSADGQTYEPPKTWDEFVELIDANIEEKVTEVKSQEKQVLLDELFQESTPAVKFILQNAGQFKTIEELLPLINSVQQQDDFASLDITNPDDQEFIVATALSLQGFDNATIADEIADFKARGVLEARSEKLKPILDNYSAQQTQYLLEEKAIKEQNDQIYWNNHFEKINTELIQAKDIDGIKFKQDDKNLIASALLPNQQLGQLPIFSIIDELVGKGNIKLLSKLVLLAVDEAKFDSYYGTAKTDAATKGLQRTLRSSLRSATDTVETVEQIQPRTTQKSTYGNFLNS